MYLTMYHFVFFFQSSNLYIDNEMFQVEVITGEENETELYAQLAKLYRFSSVEWKERGKGIVKILKHKDTGKLR